MTDPMILSGTSSNLDSLRSQLIAGSEKVQLQIIPQLAELGNQGLEVIQEFLWQRREQTPTPVDGKIYQLLYSCGVPEIKDFLQVNFPQGVVPLKSEQGIDYIPLVELLAISDFQAADRLTIQKMCELAGEEALKRKWLYFTEVENFPVTDLQTMNQLWFVYSEGKFGFSVQREIWLGLGKSFESLWTKINWKKGNTWTRYPNEFTWDLTAPRGHLPLSNQLRGVRVIASLFSHPAWDNKK
ncbi:GUN4 domain-containing protein [Calothrix sp. 336/3]|uniref:GUN4 domain-containing protein n=1 Tax=Calothrix sp. 336/3 TaxID=1337936 RepID=UPI0004E41B24|nr:GUN4 domain-containing protein [Calothrix sp. 336/3]AKG23365.1 hypothetical protein IJ00_20635 [Calothrix sp. 336/3]